MLACEPMPSIRWIITALLLGCCSLRLRNEMQRSTLQPNETVRKKRHDKSATRFTSSSALLVIAAPTDDTRGISNTRYHVQNLDLTSRRFRTYCLLALPNT